MPKNLSMTLDKYLFAHAVQMHKHAHTIPNIIFGLLTLVRLSCAVVGNARGRFPDKLDMTSSYTTYTESDHCVLHWLGVQRRPESQEMNVCVGSPPPPCVFMRGTSFSDTRFNRRLAAIFYAQFLVLDVYVIQKFPPYVFVSTTSRQTRLVRTVPN